MATLGVIFVALSAYLSVVLSQPHVHVHPQHVTSETYVINVQLSSTGQNQPNISWNITSEDRKNDPNIEVIAQAINIWAHGITNPEVLSGEGFQGLSIDHFVNGKYVHTFKLPKCTKQRLGKAIISRTAGNALSVQNRTYLMDSIDACNQPV